MSFLPKTTREQKSSTGEEVQRRLGWKRETTDESRVRWGWMDDHSSPAAGEVVVVT